MSEGVTQVQHQDVLEKIFDLKLDVVTLSNSLNTTNNKLQDLITTLDKQSKAVSANKKWVVGTFLASLTTATSIVSIIFLVIK